MSIDELLAHDDGSIPALIHLHAIARPAHAALIAGDDRIDYAGLDAQMDRVAAALQRDGAVAGGAIAIAAASSIAYVAVYLGAVRAGVSVAPLQPSVMPASLAAMIRDAGASHVFFDDATARALAAVELGAARIALDGSTSGAVALDAWLAPVGAVPRPVELAPDAPFNLIYSSGTTGTPKGIVQSHRMRWAHVRRGGLFGYGPEALTLVSTPLYSNTTLVSLFPTLALGGTAVLLARFEPGEALRLAAHHRVTHAMLVPVQYERLLAHEAFDRTDLSSFRMKFCTSAPFSAALKAEVLRRWPGGLIEYFGMTEGGGTCMLVAHQFPDKLHTVGRPAEGHDMRVIDDDGRELLPGTVGEVVGASPAAMMTGYHGQPAATAATEWCDATGKRFIRTGDLGSFDADGFLTIIGRKKDVIISGGFNVYPVDLEAALAAHPAVADVAVVGVPSPRWGETPIAFVVLRGAVDQVAFKSASPSPALTAHELTHVVQHSQNPQGKTDGSVDTAGEAEAEAVEAAVSSGKPAHSALRSGGGGLGLKSIAKGPAFKKRGPALEGGEGSKFGMGMTFSLEGFEKSYDYTIWKGHYPWPTPVPGVNFVVDPSVKVSGKGAAKFGGESKGDLSAQLGVFGECGVGLSGGIPDVAEIYGTFNPAIEGAFTLTKHGNAGGEADKAGEHKPAAGEHAGEHKEVAKGPASTWSLVGAIGLKAAVKIGVSLGGGIVDQAFELGSIEICKLTGVYFDQTGFRTDKIGFEWSEKIKQTFETIKALVEKAKRLGKAGIEAAKKAGRFVGGAVNATGRAIGDGARAVGNAASGVGNAAVNAAGAFGHWVMSW